MTSQESSSTTKPIQPYIIGIDRSTGQYRRLGAQPSTSVIQINSTDPSKTIDVPLGQFYTAGIIPADTVSTTPWEDFPEADIIDNSGNNVTYTTTRSWTLDSSNNPVYRVSGLPIGDYLLKVSAIKGDQGEPGVKGNKGSDGYTPYIGPNGNWTVGDADTKVQAQGPQGPSPRVDDNTGTWWVGDTDTKVKAQGPQGSPGNTPYIGSNGNWIIGDTDTNVKAQGPQGDPGADGDTPVRGTDYWTTEDQEAIKSDIETYIDEYIIEGKW